MVLMVHRNITFSYNECWVAYEEGIAEENSERALGFTRVTLPTEHIYRMKKEGLFKEVKYRGKTFNILPHTEIEDYNIGKKNRILLNEPKESINTDLNIVYFSWLLGKQSKYLVNIECENPYWIFHDIAHTNDVAGSEVCCLNSNLEEHRLKQGLELMIEAGFQPEFSDGYYELIKDSFYSRWRVPLDNNIFKPYITEQSWE